MEVTDEIKARIDTVEFISRYVPLQRAGRMYKACCPFHEERTPSFVVYPESGTWHCFGACSTGGDIFSFLMKKENVDFREALQMLAQETGVELTQPEGDRNGRERELHYEINGLAAQFFRNNLHRHAAAQSVRQYLQKRGVDRAAAEVFQLGYALESWDSLRDTLAEQGFSFEQLLKAGLLKYNEERDSYYDTFRNRLIIPIRDRQGRTIGFGGRVLDDSLPKYLNTSETLVFQKSRIIYGLDLAYRSIRDVDTVVIVEGYMDVIAAHQHGFENVVACMGTALTADQLRQLQRYTSHFVLALDADAAGQQATIRGLNQARQALTTVRKPTISPSGRVQLEERLGANLRIVALPEGRDPDDIIRQDPAAWPTLVAGAQPLVDFYFRNVADQYDLESAQGKGEAVAELAPLIAELNDDIERQHYIQQLSRLVHVDEQTIQGRVRAAARTVTLSGDQKGRSRTRRSMGRPRVPGSPDGTNGLGSAGPPLSLDFDAGFQFPADVGQESPADEPLQLSSAHRPESETLREQFLLAHLLQEPNLLIWLSEQASTLEIDILNFDDLHHPEHQDIFQALKRYLASDEPWDVEAFQETLNRNLHGRLAGLIAYAAQLPGRQPQELQEATFKTLVRMRLERVKNNLSAVQFLLNEAEQAGNRQEILEYSIANNRNLRERHHLEQVMRQVSRTSYGTERPNQGVFVS